MKREADGAGVIVERGTMRDLRLLERFHYVSGRPASPVLVLRARRASGGVVGVLSVSMPVLNGGWRCAAWPRAFEGERDRASALNRLVRTISRVIVDPAERGTGVGTTLVRAYVEDPLTGCTEAIASMGRVSPLFERAGMRRIEPERAARDWRLIDALEHASLTAMDLADEDRSLVAMRRAFVRREVERWLNASRGTRGLRHCARRERAMAAARAIIARPLVYVCGEPREGRVSRWAA